MQSVMLCTSFTFNDAAAKHFSECLLGLFSVAVTSNAGTSWRSALRDCPTLQASCFDDLER